MPRPRQSKKDATILVIAVAARSIRSATNAPTKAAARDSNELWRVEINGRAVEATKADMDDYNNERNLAMHESAHAVGHWIMGHELGYMQFNDDRTDIDNNHADKLAAVTVGGGPASRHE